MKKIAGYVFFCLLAAANLFYLVLTADSFYQEYLQDNFVYWGYPQWGWLYSDPEVYFSFHSIYIPFLVVMTIAGIFLWRKKYVKTALGVLLLPLLTAAAFLYMPFYNWNQQFEIYTAEKTNEKSRVPEGKWWVSVDQMQRYYDASVWERLKGAFGRGEWPGGYALWGDYRVWMLPDFTTDTLGRRGMVIHGGTQESSPWGIDMGDNVIDLAIQLRSNKKPVELNVRYDQKTKQPISEEKALNEEEKAFQNQ